MFSPSKIAFRSFIAHFSIYFAFCIRSGFVRQIVFAVFLGLFFQVAAIAQTSSTDGTTPQYLTPGAPAGSYGLSAVESVNLFNGNLNFSLPLLGVGGRGTAGYTMTLAIDQKWQVRKDAITQPGETDILTPFGFWWGRETSGYSPGVIEGRQGGIISTSAVGCGFQPDQVYQRMLTRLTFTAADGTEFELRDQLTGGRPISFAEVPCESNGNSRGQVFVTADGTSATFISDTPIYDYKFPDPGPFSPSGYLLFKNGTRYRIDTGRVSWIRDSNGNKISFTYGFQNGYYRVSSITDSFNRQVTITYNNGSTQPDLISFKGASGAIRTIKVWYASMSTLLRPGDSIQTHAQLFPGLNQSGGGTFPFDPLKVSRVELPDNRSYQFRYNRYGELAIVELPTGGKYEYEWGSGFPGDPPNSSGSDGALVIYRRVTTRRVYKDSSTLENKTIYSLPEIGGDAIVTVETKAANDVLLSKTIHTFHRNPYSPPSFIAPISYPHFTSGREKQSDIYNIINGSPVLQRRTINTWVQRAPVSWWTEVYGPEPPNDPRIAETVTTLFDVAPNLVSKTTFTYDQYNNPTEVNEYGFGTGTPGPLLRHSATTYLTTNQDQGNINYATDLNIHIRNLPTDVTVFDGNGAKVAETDYVYDSYGVTGFPILQDCPLIVQHDPAFHQNYVTRGNLVQVSKLLTFPTETTPAVYIYNKFQYDLAGNLVKKIDGRGKETSIDYTDHFGAPDGDARSSTGPAELGGQKSYAFPTAVVQPLGLVTRTQYDYYTGKAVDIEDPNNFTGSLYYEDTLDRPTKMINAVGTGLARQTLYVYNDNASAVDGNPAHSITTISDKTAIGESGSGNGLKSLVLYDGLGRTRRKAVYEGDTSEGNTWLITDIQFDALGRTWKVSNPFRLNSPDGAAATSEWTTTEYDALSRVIKVTTPDGAHVDTVYAGNQVTVTDQAGKNRRSETDALGRLTKVTEDPGGLNYDTTYLYDALDNLIKVTQGSQPSRTFAYDSLSRLISATNPESGPITYAYDANGNLLSKIDARNITTNYTYDDLNRNTRIEYSSYDNGSSVVERYYDNPSTGKNGKGRFWYEIAQNKRWEKATENLAYQQSTVDSYDALGRPLSLTQRYQLANASYKNFILLRNYDLAGNVTSQSYPSSRAVTYTIDTAGRLKSFQGSIGDFVSRAYVTDIKYNGYGSVSREAYGTQTPLYLNMHYNNRLQMVDLRLGTNADDENDLSGGALTYYYGTNAKNSGDPFANSADNNGNVLRHVNTVPLAGGGQVVPQMDDYSYDALNRITAVDEQQRNQGGTSIPLFTQSFSYDQWGNRTINLGATTIGIPGVTRKSFAIDTGTNRLTSVDGIGMTYDVAGNQTYDGVGERYYDNENRMTKVVQGGQTHYYFYDASGKRVRRILNGSQTSGGQETWFVYGFDGELVAEYTYNQVSPPSDTATVKEYGYLGGKLLVVWDSTQSGDKRLKWMVTDHLGSTRMEVDKSGSLAGIARIDLLPFGEQLSVGVGIRSASIGYGGDSSRQKFTGYERDSETGLDFAQSRYFASMQGRFTSTDEFKGGPDDLWVLGSGDPEKQALAYANITIPQSLNKYQYCFNNPLRYVDTDGQNPQDGGRGRAEERDVRALAEGRITPEEFKKRQQERVYYEGIGAVIGIGIVVAPSATMAVLAWMGRNPATVINIGQEAVQMSQGSPLPAIPLGFNSIGEFSRFSSSLKGGLAKVADDAVALFQGSSVTGVKYTTGVAFDVGRVSDFDIGIASAKLFAMAKALGIELRSRGTRTGALSEEEVAKLGLTSLQQQLSKQAGRPVNFMLFQSVEAAITKTPSIIVQ